MHIERPSSMSFLAAPRLWVYLIAALLDVLILLASDFWLAWLEVSALLFAPWVSHFGCAVALGAMPRGSPLPIEAAAFALGKTLFSIGLFFLLARLASDRPDLEDLAGYGAMQLLMLAPLSLVGVALGRWLLPSQLARASAARH